MQLQRSANNNNNNNNNVVVVVVDDDDDDDDDMFHYNRSQADAKHTVQQNINNQRWHAGIVFNTIHISELSEIHYYAFILAPPGSEPTTSCILSGYTN